MFEENRTEENFARHSKGVMGMDSDSRIESAA